MSECKRCGTELTKDKDRNCLYCPLCHPPKNKSVPMEELEKNYVDVEPSEMRKEAIIKIIKNVVPDLIREELENWHIQNPAVEPIVEEPTENKNWRDEAKELGISLSQPTGGARKKVDVITDIEKKRMTQ